MTEQQKKIELNLLEAFLVPLLMKLVSLLGDNAFDWIKEKLEGKGVSTNSEPPPKDEHGCIIGKQIWNPIKNRCEDNI